MYISVFVRAQKYDSNEYESNPVSYHMTEYTTPLVLIGTFQLNRITITEEVLDTDDKFHSLGIFTDSQTFYTTSNKLETSEFDRGPDQSEVTLIEFYRSRERKEHKRSIYGPLNLLGDVGGLADALFWIGSALVYSLQIISGSSLV